MAGVAANLTLTGELDEFKDSLHELRRFDWRGLNRELGHAVRTSTLRRFNLGVGPDGVPWKPSQRVEAAKKAQECRKTLIGPEGRLRRSINVRAYSDYAEVGTDVIYARIHQLGGKTGRGHAVTMPARPYLGVSGEDETIISTMVKSALAEAFKSRGGAA